jgi:hypothetical protein
MVGKQTRTGDVCSWPHREESRLAEDRFSEFSSRGRCRYGDYREVGLSSGGAAAAVVEGVLCMQSLDADGSASIGLRYSPAAPDSDSQRGFCQKKSIEAGISIGAESGEVETASGVLGEERGFAFRSHLLA